MGRMNREIIFATSSYNKKFYFADKTKTLPVSIRDEVKKIGIFLVNKVGGIFSLGFYDDGEMFIEYSFKDDDLSCDEIGAKLEIELLKRENRELFENLEVWYKLF